MTAFGPTPRALAFTLTTGLAAAALVWGSAAGQGKTKEETCPWCRDDPKVLEAASLVGHGPMPFSIEGRTSADVARTLPGLTWRFLETKHLRLATSLGAEVVTLQERPRVEAELDRLRAAIPSVPKKVQTLDPWLRLHLTAMKCEELYARFQQLLRVTDADFPESRIHGQPFMGNGRYLGEKEKFELVLHANRKTHFLYTQDVTGARVNDALRWHLKNPHKMMASMPAEDGDLRQDKYLLPHVAHNLTHLLFNAYKHFSWDPPAWLDEGLAHLFELESAKDINITFCSDEGAGPERERGKDWTALARGLAERGKNPSMATLMERKMFADLTKDEHVAAWSRVQFLASAHGESFARFLGDLKGRLDESGNPTGKDLPAFTRTKLKELWGWTPADLDTAWAAWVVRPR